MLDEKIYILRQKLHNSILEGQDYSITYKISVELDELIAKYYKRRVRCVNKNTKFKLKNIKRGTKAVKVVAK